MKILITGASGFLGKEIVERLKGCEVFTIGRKESDIICDLSNSIPKDIPIIDIVIHAAGIAHITPVSISENQMFFDVNYGGTVNLFKSLNNLSVLPKYFVFVSSVAVYGINEGHNVNEMASLKAKDPYGKSKLETEIIVMNWCFKNNVICTILRLPLLVGANAPGNLGSMINAIRNNYYFNISDGTARKSMVLTSDVARYILKAAEVGGTYNLTDGYHPNFNELSHCIAKQISINYVPNMSLFFAKILAFIGDMVGRKFPINSDKLHKITSTLTFDDSKARKAFGWNPKRVLNGFKINN